MKRVYDCEDDMPNIQPLGHADSATKSIDYPYKKLKHVRFPDKLEALPDILADINEWAKSPEEATVEAVLNSQQDRFEHLKRRFGYEGLGKAMTFAAESGLLRVVKFMIAHGGEYHEAEGADAAESQDEEEEPDAYLSWESKRDAAVAAAGNNHLDIVEYLFQEIILTESDSEDEDEDRIYQAKIYEGNWDVLEKAAENGHLRVVTFAVAHAKDRSYWHWYHRYGKANALTRASSQGHIEVVRFLLGDREGGWDTAGAFEAAAVAQQYLIALMLHEAYERDNRQNLFIEMATAGRIDAVKYLYNRSGMESGLCRDGFLAAVAKDCTGIIGFFLDAGGVSSDLFDEAIKLASSSGKVKAFTLLYNKKRASAHSLTKAFEASGSLAITKLLYENESVSPSSITAAFRNAAHYCFKATVKTFSSEQYQQSIEIVTFLHTEECIPSEVVSETFSQSVANQPLDVVKAMLKMHRIAPEAIGEALVRTASNGRPIALVELLVGTRLVPQVFLDQALVKAARGDRKRAIRVMHQQVEWSKDAVEEALRLTKNRKIRKILQQRLDIQTYW